MFLPILLGSDMSDSDTLSQVSNQFLLTHPGQIFFSVPLPKMLSEYRTMRAQGKNESDMLLYWGRAGISRDYGASFIAAMKQIEKGQAVQDPTERPSLNEVVTGYADQIGSVTAKLPWGKIIAAVVGYIAVTQIAKKHL